MGRAVVVAAVIFLTQSTLSTQKDLWFASSASSAFQPPTAPKKGGNPEAAKIKDPVVSSPESITAGRRVYQRLCTRCHGSQGKGDGGAAGAVPSDLSDAQWDYGGSDGEIFSSIHDGTSADMEGYAARISD